MPINGGKAAGKRSPGVAKLLLLRFLCGWLALLLAGPALAEPTPEPVINIDQNDIPGEPTAPPSSGVTPIPRPSLPAERVRLGPEAAALVDMINAYRAKMKYPPLHPAADLTQVAQDHARDMLAHGFVDIDSRYRGSHQQRLWEAGVSDPSPLSFALVADARERLNDTVIRDAKLFSSLQDRELSHVGVGVVIGTNALIGRAPVRCLTVELANRSVRLLLPQRRRYSPGETVRVLGILNSTLQAPQVIIMPPNCTTLRPAVEVDDHGTFRAQFTLQAGKGQYFIEVLPNGPLGPVLTNLLPIYVGVSPPSPLQTYTQAKAGAARAGKPIPLATGRQLMLGLLNKDREHCGLKPLQYSTLLERMAQGHSEDMFRNRYFAHISPTQGNVRQRAEALKMRFLKIGENLAINGSIEEAERGLMLSPAHRGMILDPDVDYVGIGIVQGDDPLYGKQALWITQNFARFLPEGAEILPQ